MPSITRPSIHLPLPDLIAALEARRPLIRKLDAEVLKHHKAEEKRWLVVYRNRLKEMLALPYEQAKKVREVRFDHAEGFSGYAYPPSCPDPMERRLDAVLAPLLLSQQTKTIIVAENGSFAGAYQLLTFDPDPKPEAC